MHLINYCVPKFHEMLTAVKFNFFQLSINTFHFDLEYGVFYYTHFFKLLVNFILLIDIFQSKFTRFHNEVIMHPIIDTV